MKVVKNKVAPPFREAEFDMMYGEGISREGDLIDQGVERNIVEKSGTWFSYGGERLGQGRENAKAFLKQNPHIASEIEKKLRAAMGLADAVDRAKSRLIFARPLLHFCPFVVHAGSIRQDPACINDEIGGASPQRLGSASSPGLNCPRQFGKLPSFWRHL